MVFPLCDCVFLVVFHLVFFDPMFHQKKFLDYAASIYHLGIVITAIAFAMELLMRQKSIREEKSQARVVTAERGIPYKLNRYSDKWIRIWLVSTQK